MLRFTKMQGIGNDFVMVDAIRDGSPTGDLPALAKAVCDRRYGVGADGLILLEPGFRMRMWNPDGSESEMCGNGIRCLGRLIRDHGHAETDTLDVETGAGKLRLQFVGRDLRVDMGTAQALGPMMVSGYAGTAVSMGNPHFVIVTEDVAAIELSQVGPRIETDPQFPDRTNVHFVQVLGPAELRMRTWERGAGITLACGTGACSVGVAISELGLAGRDLLIHLPGGDLRVEVSPERRVFMTGPAETAFEGVFAG